MSIWAGFAGLMKWAEDLWQVRWWLPAVILPTDSQILYLNDSKKLTAAKREKLYEVIMREAVAVGLGMAHPERIHQINILQATYEAMREAVGKLSVMPQAVAE